MRWFVVLATLLALSSELSAEEWVSVRGLPLSISHSFAYENDSGKAIRRISIVVEDGTGERFSMFWGSNKWERGEDDNHDRFVSHVQAEIDDNDADSLEFEALCQSVSDEELIMKNTCLFRRVAFSDGTIFDRCMFRSRASRTC